MIPLDKLFPLNQLPRKALNRLRQRPDVQRALTPFGRSLEPERWIFVVGCYNSGTTLLANLLDAHPQIAGLPIEGVNLTDSLPRPEEFGWVRMWCRCLDEVRLEPGPGMAERADRAKRQWSIWYPKDAPNLVEKSIANTARMPFLQHYFQPAYFIHIVRNGYAVAEGIRRKADPRRWKNPEYGAPYPIELCAEQWRVSDEVVEQDRLKLDRFLQVYYEELTAEPRTVMDRIIRFLELPPLPAEAIDRSWTVQGIHSPIRNMNAQSIDRLTSADIERIHQEAKERLAQHGYDHMQVEMEQ
ncbi:MAG: sulfotransferase [Salinibacter sp.]